MSDALFPQDSPCTRSSLAPYCARVKAMVTPRRYEHILRVAALAETIGRANGFSDSELRAVALAAILHDAARELPPEELFALAPPETELERENPLTLHGRAARTLAERWGVTDERVLDAIENHVFGPAKNDPVGMALYVADVSEPGRGVNDDVRELAMHNLFRAYQRAINTKVEYLRAKGKAVHPATLRAYQELRESA